MLVYPNELFVCYQCYPGVLATDIVPKPGAPGKYMQAPDFMTRASARRQAEADGQAYEVIFPDSRAEIEAVLRSRPSKYMNWRPGETVELLIAENEMLGVRNGL